MIQDVHAVGVEKDPVFHVTNEGVICPTVPQAGHHVVKFSGFVVPLGMRDVLLEAKIEGRLWVGRGDEVPAGAPITDVVQRCELPCDMIGIVESGGRGGDEAQTFGDHSQSREKRERIKGRRGRAAFEGVHRHVQQGQMIGHEERVEFGAFQGLGEPGDMAKIKIGIRVGAGVTPPCGVDTDRAHKRPQSQLSPL